MEDWAGRLGSLGDVHRFDYPYMIAGRRRPDRHALLLSAHRAELELVAGSGPIFLVGKSMGSRIGCHVATTERVSGLICFGYPLVSMSGKLRDEVLFQLRTPILFVQGTRDRLCPLAQLEAVRPSMAAQNTLFVVEEGDHSLQITKRHTKKTGQSQDDMDATVFEAVRAFVAAHQ